MNRDSSFAKSLKKGTWKSEKECKAFEDISKYISKEEWAKLGYSEKITYVYMKRNYDTMTSLGLRAKLPAFMCPKKGNTKSRGHNSGKGRNPRNQDEPPQKASSVQQRKRQKVMRKKPAKEKNDSKPVPVTPGSKQAHEQLCPLGEASTSGQQSEKTPGPGEGKTNVWAHRLRKNPVAYEEISHPEEDD
uniref:KRAB-related domain-containing protein n=1 Tax=Equus asinus TaxID=9793 RepID=A0A9L0IWB3_EQUAS